jgi:hypothetical protein
MTASTASRAGWTLGVAGAAPFMTALDQLVAGVALHSIDLGGSIEGLERTVNAYTPAFAVLLIAGAALGDRFGRKYANGSTRPAGPPGTSSRLWPRRPHRNIGRRSVRDETPNRITNQPSACAVRLDETR